MIQVKAFHFAIPYSVLALMATMSCSSAQETDRCIELVKECFAYSGQERDACFRASAEHTFCEGTETRALAAMRSQFSLLNPDRSEVAPSFVGFQLIDRVCLANFDSTLSGALIKGAPSRETYAALGSELQRCAHSPASDVIRP